jgi:hypothetical protein
MRTIIHPLARAYDGDAPGDRHFTIISPFMTIQCPGNVQR